MNTRTLLKKLQTRQEQRVNLDTMAAQKEAGFGGSGPTVPTALTDLDTTVTGAQLNAKHNISTLADLAQTISATYVQAEVQAISDKIDALLAILRTGEIISATASLFLRPGGVDQYFRPGGVDSYNRP